ncbi:hypothetical protein F2Q68_00028252 [Brassica cretica]|uniref:cytokinin dehydrogenase n=1 Tax=Brassica cretica TaxID=69181 RepID=A0A8S9I7S5_BRACR|nr:hypothetical protein F2Q68_00028252 [Brassica cretica]
MSQVVSTLSNAGISGQAFKHGPQINNVYQLEIVTGKGEVVTCSEKRNSELFQSVLGGLGQFGIITRARISLGPAPLMVKFHLEHNACGFGLVNNPRPRTWLKEYVKWIRALYSDFSAFSKDQEHLISKENAFDYVEGFVIINRTDILNNWRSSFTPNDSTEANQFKSDGKTLYCLEVVKYFNSKEANSMNQETEKLLSELSYIPSTLFSSEVPYIETNLCSNPSLSTPIDLPPSDTLSSLDSLDLEGYITFHDVHNASKDFGNRYHLPPLAILHPKSVSDISTVMRHIVRSTSNLTVAARGHGHSLQGQALAHQGVVINMESLRSHDIKIYKGKQPYVDVSGGELWINILRETLKYGLSPKSWTDYLHLTVGGTLSNAGISGQAFKHGPQINNVYQLEIVTGKGEVVTCSEKRNSELFQSVLGGLGQFGIITRARISLGAAPLMVKWIRALYSDFSAFSRDQEHLISKENAFDYVEGFVIINRTDILNNWRSSFTPNDSTEANQFKSDGKTLYCLEVVKYFNSKEANSMNQVRIRLSL